MTIKFHNTLSRQIEEFRPIKEGEVELYSCGPTVYNYPHIGNLRGMTFYDLLKRYLKYKKLKVTHVMNITDVDDKIIKRSREEGKEARELAEYYTDEFIKQLGILNIQLPDIMPKATEEIPAMVELIKTLLARDFAYQTEKGDIYFKVKAFDNYGELAGLDKAKLKAGASGRVNLADEYDKEEIGDFALWKAYDEEDGDVFWETELGKGRPGWHIECSAMAMKHLGRTFDIHTGGVDLIFPHHTNEIAQSEACTGQKFASYWMHNAHLIVDGKKMSKSLGNFYVLQDLLDKGYRPAAIRFEFLKTHYRSVLDFREESLKASEGIIDKFNDFISRLMSASGPGSGEAVDSPAEEALRKFEDALDDDLNISLALSAVYDFMGAVNKLDDPGKAEAEKALSVMESFDSVLGVMNFAREELPEKAKKLIEEREEARKARDFSRSDEIREELKAMGILIEDTPRGTHWKKIQ